MHVLRIGLQRAHRELTATEIRIVEKQHYRFYLREAFNHKKGLHRYKEHLAR
jgi:hypothetical protein